MAGRVHCRSDGQGAGLSWRPQNPTQRCSVVANDTALE